MAPEGAILKGYVFATMNVAQGGVHSKRSNLECTYGTSVLIRYAGC